MTTRLEYYAGKHLTPYTHLREEEKRMRAGGGKAEGACDECVGLLQIARNKL